MRNFEIAQRVNLKITIKLTTEYRFGNSVFWYRIAASAVNQCEKSDGRTSFEQCSNVCGRFHAENRCPDRIFAVQSPAPLSYELQLLKL